MANDTKPRSERTKKIMNLLDEITDGLQWAPRDDRLRAMGALHILGNIARLDGTPTIEVGDNGYLDGKTIPPGTYKLVAVPVEEETDDG